MLKSLVSGARSAYTCLCVTRSPALTNLSKSVGNVRTQGQRWLHVSSAMNVLNKDVRNKKSQIKMSQAFKVDTGAENTPVKSEMVENSDILGSDQSIAIIPNLNTNSMLINGVRFDQLPILHIKCSPNNTIVLLTDHTGNKKLGRTSCGKEGFRNTKKSSTVAAQATGLSIGYMAIKNGAEYVRVAIKGIGSGRMPTLKGVTMAGVKIVSITDRTPIFVNGPRPRKPRRL